MRRADVKHVSPIILLMTLLTPTVFSSDSIITVTPESGSEIIDESHFQAVWSSPFSDDSPPFNVESDIPVSLLRYNVKETVAGNNAVIMDNEVIVYVKTNCPDIFDGVSVSATTEKNGGVTGIKISSDVDVPAELLPNSNFGAVWNFTFPWCDEGHYPSKGKAIRGFSPRQRSKDPTDEEDSEDVPSENCKVTAEILYDACFRKFETISPILKVSDAFFVDIVSSRTEKLECTNRYEANLMITEQFIESSNTTILTKKYGRRECMRIAPGRPYFNSDGKQLQSYAFATPDSQSCWSKPIAARNDEQQPILELKDKALSQKPNLSSEWTERSLGEHASIASFAVFTISLMTNNAPPDLIRDALHAALDEVDHATTSFEIASILAGEAIEPGPLPQSSHEFANDIGTLMESTFKEGCIDETLSALAAAAEADNYSSCDDDSEDDGRCGLEGELKTRLTKIALDEARHSALAWRTIVWACGVDAASCGDNIDPYLQDAGPGKQLSEAPERAFPLLHADFKSEWKTIYKTLLPFVIAGGQSDDIDSMCSEYVSASRLDDIVGSDGLSLVKVVSDRIIYEVLCGSFAKQYRKDTLSPLSE
mmetsp:Transcript_59088/g.70475  ORF Transcript_59088/g.70475 Transcript_59088/m.70475 type:complete len:595 (-) Transcript_59088:310-2094(-)